jgi:hypothetical protein
VSKYAGNAILALPADAPARQWRLLAALGTFRRNPKTGTLCVSLPALVELTGLSDKTVRTGRDDLVAMGLLKYQQGTGRGVLSQYLITAPDRPALSKGGSPDAVTSGSANLSAAVKVVRGGNKGGKPDAVTSGNVTQSVLTQSIRSSDARAGAREGTPDDDQIIIETYEAVIGERVSPEEAARARCELERRARNGIGQMRGYAAKCIRGDPEEWLRIARGDDGPAEGAIWSNGQIECGAYEL